MNNCSLSLSLFLRIVTSVVGALICLPINTALSPSQDTKTKLLILCIEGGLMATVESPLDESARNESAGNGSAMNDSDPCGIRPLETWWIYIATSVSIYLICLGLSSAAFAAQWLAAKRRKETSRERGPTMERLYASYKSIRSFFRWLLLRDSIPSKIFVSVNLLCNIVYLLLGVHRSYHPSTAGECFKICEEPEKIIEMVVVLELFFFAIVRFLASTNVVLYWFELHTLVDVFTIPHIYVSAFLGMDWIGLRFLRFVWLTQITSVLHFMPFVNSNSIDIISLLVNFLVLWLTSSGIIHLFETQGDPWQGFGNGQSHSLLEYAYLIMATVSTVGYGDIHAVTDLGRIFITFFIIAGLAFFAAILPKIVEVMSNYYERTQYSSFNTTRVSEHVIVCGHITEVTAEDFLKDFLHPDRGDHKTHVLFLHPEKPDPALRNVLSLYYTRVQYLKGSVLNGSDLKKAEIATSRAIFILANKHTSYPTEEDNANLLRLVSVKNTTTSVRVIIQLIHSFSKYQVYTITGWNKQNDIALCLNEMKLGLLAQSCLCPGFSTLIANLFYTSDFEKHLISFKKDDPSLWKKPYITGASNELYSSTFSEYFEGKTFHQAALTCYNELNLVLIAVEDAGKLYVNPCNTSYSDISHTKGYFIAQNQEQVKVVKDYDPGYIRHGIGMSSLFTFSGFHHHNMHETTKKYPTILSDITIKIDEVSSSLTSDIAPKKMIADSVSNGDLMVVSSFGSPRKGRLQKYASEPNRLDKAILNPDNAFLDSTSNPLEVEIQDHIILCLFADKDSPLIGLDSFLNPLRNIHLPYEDIKPVVIISNRSYIEKEWSIIRSIPKVHVVNGNPMHWSNLEAARVSECSVCVILTVPSGTCTQEHGINDKEAILCCLSIQNAKKINQCNKTVRIITDLRQESNVQFLDFGDEDEPDERIYKAQPFACGEAFSVSMFDSVTSSVFHIPGVLHLVESLIHVSGTDSTCQAVALPISNGFYNGKFKDYYNSQVLNDGNICMGIFRKMKEGSSQRYVITSPAPELDLEPSDIALLLTNEGTTNKP